jgi:hypothetical protein
MRAEMTPGERQAIQESVNRDWVHLSFEHIGLGKIDRRPVDTSYPLEEYEQDSLFAMLSYKGTRILATEHAQAQIHTAARRNDFNFFIRLGRVLSKKPRPVGTYGDVATVFQKFLLEHWIDERDRLPELCRLTGAGLTEVCRARLSNSLHEAGIVKERARLNLLLFNRDKISAKLTDKRLFFYRNKKRLAQFG